MITAQDTETQLQADGFLRLNALFSADEIAEIRGKTQGIYQNSETGVEVHMLGNCADWLLQTCVDQRIASVLVNAGVLDPEFLSVKTVMKDATCRFASPWHQDRPYWGGGAKYSLWIALDDCEPSNGCLRVIPGSHADGFVDHNAIDDVKFQNRVADDMINEDEVVDLIMCAGDAILFHDCLLHASYENTSGLDRYSLISTYRSARINDASTLWSQSYRMC